jgi:hypothetical protein
MIPEAGPKIAAIRRDFDGEFTILFTMANVNESTPTDEVQSPFDEADTVQGESPVPVDIETAVEQPLTPALNDSSIDIDATCDNEEKSPASSPSKETELDDSFEREGVAPAEARSSKALEKKRLTRKNLFCASFIILVLIGAALGIVFGVGAMDGGSSGSQTSSTGSQEIPPDSNSPENPPDSNSPENPPDSNSPPPSPSPTQDGETESAPPTDPLLAVLLSFSNNGLDDPDSPQWEAYQWMANDDPLTTADTETARLKQRYALATLYAALADEMPQFALQEECAWPTVACGTQNATADWQVSELNMANQSFTGTIPPEIELLAPSLVKLDMADNPELHGSIPEELYNLVNLKYLYLHHNAMTGTLSESFGKTQLLQDIYLGNNAFTGPIPDSLGSRQGTRPLRKLIFRIALTNSFVVGKLTTFTVPYDCRLSNSL